MSDNVTHINPIRFRYNSTPNNRTTWPNSENMDQRVIYFIGEYPVSFYKPHVINRPIYIQFRFSGLTDERLLVTKPDLSTEYVNPSDISPSGWVGTPVLLYEYTPTIEGVYQFEQEELNYISDKVRVVDQEKFRKQLIEIKYTNSENDFNAVFVDESLNTVYNPITYFTGMLLEGGGYNELEIFRTQRGVPSKQRATPLNTYTLVLSGIQRTQMRMINRIFSLDRLVVNNIPVENTDIGEWTKINKLDIGNVTIELTQTGDNDYVLEI